MEFQEEEINEIWTHDKVINLGLSTLVQRKFMRKWKKLTSQSASIRGYIVITAKEQEAMDKMKTTLTQIDLLLEQNAMQKAKVTADTQRISNEIESVFGGYIAQLTERMVTLKKELTTESKKQTDALQQQYEQLNNVRDSIEDGIKEQNTMLTDTQIDAKKRQIQMEQITDSAVGAMDSETMKVEVNDIVFQHDDDRISEFVSTVGSVGGRPDPPVLDISGITASVATVTFHSEHDKDAVVYSMRYRQKSGGDDDEKESEWTEQVLSKGTDRYTLSGLSPRTRYEVRGQYQVMDTMVKSALSDTISFVSGEVAFEWDQSRSR